MLLLLANLLPCLLPSHVTDPSKHLHNVETRLDCPQTFLSLDFQCRDDVSELKQTFQDEKELRISKL